MITKLLYPLFLLRLSLLFFFFLIRVVFVLYPKIILIILSLLMATINSTVFIQNKLVQKTDLKANEDLSKKTSSLEIVKTNLEKANTKQDGHQGILLNLSRIEKKLGNVSKEEEYLQKSKDQNPNSLIFQKQN